MDERLLDRKEAQDLMNTPGYENHWRYLILSLIRDINKVFSTPGSINES